MANGNRFKLRMSDITDNCTETEGFVDDFASFDIYLFLTVIRIINKYFAKDISFGILFPESIN